ncbi:MAG: hypothetical protein M3Y34_00470, partial [Actinomycetota bacterium]|nr:hypothetical protein [Actinomycetota bacterium]
LGIADGRYPVRETSGEPSEAETPLVLVAETLGAPAAARRRRKPKRRDAMADGPAEVPVTRLMVVFATEIEGDGEAWLEQVRRSEEDQDAIVDRGLACIRRAVGARRVSAFDPSLADPTLDTALAVRIGFGEGDLLVERGWEQAVEVPRDGRRRSRSELLRPQERMAALLGLRQPRLACEELLIRARADADAGRQRELALQMRVALEALLAERDAFGAHGQAEDLAFLDSRRALTGAAANEALSGPLGPDRVEEVTETLAVCERVLRRRAAHG